ncbi:MAG: hypothetical protein R2909_01815 [Gemmatimonadales bacterium]
MPDPRELLLALPGVEARRLGAREGFFSAGRMFALLDRGSLLLRLPTAAGADLLARSRASSIVGLGVPAVHAWVEVSPAGLEPDELGRLIGEARDAVRWLRRRGDPARPAGRRRRRIGERA